MENRENTPRETSRRESTRCLSLLPWTFHECHRKNASGFTLYHPRMDTTLWQSTRTPPEPEATVVVFELDEMWHYLKKKQKLWIWKALCRDTGELIAWECGDRDKATLKKLIERLENWHVKVYYTDNWQVYRAVIPKDKLVEAKKETHRVERNNSRMRHWFGRFKRKFIIVSKSVEIVELTIALFARFRVNGDVFDVLKIGQTQPNIII